MWVIGDGKHDQMELSKLFTNYDIMSIMQYGSYIGITSLNDFYNEVGFGNSSVVGGGSSQTLVPPSKPSTDIMYTNINNLERTIRDQREADRRGEIGRDHLGR